MTIQYSLGTRAHGAAARWAMATFGPASMRWTLFVLFRVIPVAFLAFAVLQLGTDRSGLPNAIRIVMAPVCLVPVVLAFVAGSDFGYGWYIRRSSNIQGDIPVRIEINGNETIRITFGAETVFEGRLVLGVDETRGRMMVAIERGVALPVPASAFANRAEFEAFFYALAAFVRIPADAGSFEGPGIEDAPYAFTVRMSPSLRETVDRLAVGKPSLVSRIYQRGMLVLFTGWCVLLVGGTHPIWEQSPFFWWFIPLNLAVLAYLAFPNVIVERWRRQGLEMVATDCPNLMVFDNQHVQLSAPAGVVTVPWRSVRRMAHAEGLIQLHSNTAVITIAREWFRDDDAYEGAIAFVSSRIQQEADRAA